MNDSDIRQIPAALDPIQRETASIGFTLGSEPKTGSLLRTLAASKPGGRFLELGTGTGLGTTWLLAGMDAESRLETVDQDPIVLDIAQRNLGEDSRVTFHLADVTQFLNEAQGRHYDFVYADAWPGKFSHLDLALSLLAPGGIYLVDDLLPQPNWPDDHAPKVPALIEELERRRGFVATKLAWSSGLLLLVRSHPSA